MDQVLHLSEISLPSGVELTIDPTEGDHDHPVVSVHEPKVIIEEPEVEEVEGEEGAEGAEGEAAEGDAAQAEDGASDAKAAEGDKDAEEKPAE